MKCQQRLFHYSKNMCKNKTATTWLFRRFHSRDWFRRFQLTFGFNCKTRPLHFLLTTSRGPCSKYITLAQRYMTYDNNNTATSVERRSPWYPQVQPRLVATPPYKATLSGCSWASCVQAQHHGVQLPARPSASVPCGIVPISCSCRIAAVEFYLYPTVGTVLIHSIKPELTE